MALELRNFLACNSELTNIYIYIYKKLKLTNMSHYKFHMHKEIKDKTTFSKLKTLWRSKDLKSKDLKICKHWKPHHNL